MKNYQAVGECFKTNKRQTKIFTGCTYESVYRMVQGELYAMDYYLVSLIEVAQ